MKKIIAIILSLIFVMGLFAGCGNTPKTDDQAPKATEPTTSGETTEPAPTYNTVTPGKLTMATNAFFKPYEYYEGEQIVGIDAEIAQAIAEKLGLELVINNMDFNTIINAVTSGEADFGLAAMTITPKRLEQVDFTTSYANGVQSIIVMEGSPIVDVDSLYAEGASYKIGVQLGTTGDIYARDDFGDEAVQAYNNGNEAVLALKNGDIDCIIIDNEPAKAFTAANEGLVILETSYADEDYAACLAQDNDELLAAINTAIEELIMDGTIDAIIEKYIPAN